MSLEDEKDGDRRRKSAHIADSETPDTNAKKKKRSSVPEVGNALRTVYQRTVDEHIPPEMLDLLGKLG